MRVDVEYSPGKRERKKTKEQQKMGPNFEANLHRLRFPKLMLLGNRILSLSLPPHHGGGRRFFAKLHSHYDRVPTKRYSRMTVGLRKRADWENIYLFHEPARCVNLQSGGFACCPFPFHSHVVGVKEMPEK